MKQEPKKAILKITNIWENKFSSYIYFFIPFKTQNKTTIGDIIMNKDSNALLKSIKGDLKDCKQIIRQSKAILNAGLKTLYKL